MKNIFKSSKTRKSLVGGVLAAISLFSFNFAPISVISKQFVSAAKYEATETNITENSSSQQLQASELVSNLKDYFSESEVELNLSSYYKEKYAELILTYAEEMLRDALGDNVIENTFGTSSNINSLVDYYNKSDSPNVLDFILHYVDNLSNYEDLPRIDEEAKEYTRLSKFYYNLRKHIGTSKTEAFDSQKDAAVENFYDDSEYYKDVKDSIDNEIKKTIAIVSYDGKDDNKVAAIIANGAPATSDYKYGTSYETSTTPYLNLSTNESTLDSSNPFYYYYKTSTNKWHKLNSFPYETTSNGSMMVYVIDNGLTADQKATIEFLGYTTVSESDIRADQAKGYITYSPVTYSNTQTYYYEFLYNELKNNAKINENITFEKFVNLFYSSSTSESALYIKYSKSAYKYQIYASAEDYAELQKSYAGYKYFNYVTSFEQGANMNDYVLISASSVGDSYEHNTVGDIKLYFLKERIYYTEDNVKYLNEYETEEILKVEYEKADGKNKIYVLDESEKASENKVYQSLGFAVITAPTEEYELITKDDDNYNQNLKLYYKYAEPDKAFAKNLLTTIANNGEQTAKNAIYVLTSSVDTDITNLCRINSYIPISDDDLTEGNFVKLNSGDPSYSSKYELYYKFNEDLYLKTENKIYKYTSSSTSDYTPFYKTDTNYDIEAYEKIKKDDPNFKQGFDLYYKKVSETVSNKEAIDVAYSFTTKSSSGIKFAANSYYAISFYVNTTGSNVYASLEFDNETFDNAAITGIQTNGNWVKYYAFFATTAEEISSKLILSMGSKDGIDFADTKQPITGSVLFDEVKILKINESDYLNQTINNENVYVDAAGNLVDNAEYGNAVDFSKQVNLNDFAQNNSAVSGWNNIFDFDNIEANKLSNATGGELLNLDIDSTDGYTDTFDGNDSIWNYYIGRDVSGKNNSEILEAYREAYKDGKVSISIADEKTEKPAPVEETETPQEPEALADDDKKDDDEKTEINPIVDYTFGKANKILKIDNTSTSMSLGVISKSFTIKSSECYKISLYIYSPEEKATATVKVISSIKTAQYNDYGKELSAGASDISAYLKSDDDSSANEYRWLPVTFYIQGNVLSDLNCNLVLMADEDSLVYFDNIKIEKVSTSVYSGAKTADRVYKLALTESSTSLTKLVTNGFFNDTTVTDIKAENYMPKQAQSWTVANTAAQDYVTAGIVSPKNQEFIDEFNKGNAGFATNQITNVYAINVEENQLANHNIYSTSFSMAANMVYKVTFEYYYSSNNFDGDIVASLYNDSYKAENKIASIKPTNLVADSWNSITFYIATGTSTLKAVLELGVENATGTAFFRNAYATTITKTLDEIRNENSSNISGTTFELDTDHISIIDYSKISFTLNKDNDGEVETNEFTTTSTNTSAASTGSVSVVFSENFDNTQTIEKTFTVDETTYYVYDGKVYQFPVYDGTDISKNVELDEIDNKSFVIENGVVKVGSGLNVEEYTIEEKTINNISYNFADKTIGEDTVTLSNSWSNGVLILENKNETDYTEIESNYKLSLSSTSFYALKFYVKTSDFADDFGLSIKVKATGIETNWSETLINTNNEIDALHKDANGFVCYQLLISTKKTSCTDLVVTFSLGDITNTGKGYAVIAGVELQKIATEDEFEHYSGIFANEEDESVVKTFVGNESSSSSSTNNSNSEVTWATFFYIFSSLLLVITLIMAMVAIFFKKHPIKSKKVVAENENFDTETFAKTKKKIAEDKEKQENQDIGGIE